ncbi:hypothetical protein C2845_PM02G45900 [Panicum miliaceum]|uniref:Uncharacterized protein n=1 Tax=Panicum miliaceum TaxID=4540 RepID=A0A3L6SAY6_PANMI|nr:hypothetical protein C2845_PM02G45900 [Panicum miliaceum]
MKSTHSPIFQEKNLQSLHYAFHRRLLWPVAPPLPSPQSPACVRRRRRSRLPPPRRRPRPSDWDPSPPRRPSSALGHRHCRGCRTRPRRGPPPAPAVAAAEEAEEGRVAPSRRASSRAGRWGRRRGSCPAPGRRQRGILGSTSALEADTAGGGPAEGELENLGRHQYTSPGEIKDFIDKGQAEWVVLNTAYALLSNAEAF